MRRLLKTLLEYSSKIKYKLFARLCMIWASSSSLTFTTFFLFLEYIKFYFFKKTFYLFSFFFIVVQIQFSVPPPFPTSFSLDLRFLYLLFSLPERLLLGISVVYCFLSLKYLFFCYLFGQGFHICLSKGAQYTLQPLHIYMFIITIFQQMAVKCLKKLCLCNFRRVPYWLLIHSVHHPVIRNYFPDYLI